MNLREKALSGRRIIGTMCRMVRVPAIAYFARNAGLDFFMIDAEHGPYDFQTMSDIFLTANALGVGGLVRVPCGGKEYISRALDAGAAGIMVPGTDTREQAEELVEHAKYQPVGRRAFTAIGAHTEFRVGKHAEVMAQANARVLAIAQVETRLAVENAEDIASVDGLDVLLVGPNDLSVDLGIPGDLMNPIQLDAMAAVAAACKKHGKLFGLHAGAALLEKFRKELDMVMNMTDADFLAQGFAGVRKVCDSL